MQEVAGLGGDAAYVKSETESQTSRTLFPGTVRVFDAEVRTRFNNLKKDNILCGTDGSAVSATGKEVVLRGSFPVRRSNESSNVQTKWIGS